VFSGLQQQLIVMLVATLLAVFIQGCIARLNDWNFQRFAT
jgi:hypothetical protein